MARRKKKKIEVVEEKEDEIKMFIPDDAWEEKMFRASEWATNKGLDSHLFVFWDKDGLIDERQFEEIKKQVVR